MARSINKVILLGNLTKDPELKYTQGGTAVAQLTVATNRAYKLGDGSWKEEVEFHRCVVWATLAENCSKYIQKGHKVYCEGRIQTRKYQAKDGTDRYTTEIVLDTVISCERKGTSAPQTSAGQATPDAQPTKEQIDQDFPDREDMADSVNPDDIPF